MFPNGTRTTAKTAMLLVQHVHDRVSPWTLPPLLLSYLYNLGIKVITLHDNLEAQREYATLHQKPLVPFSHFGSDRHDYERVVPTLKTFSASTFFSNFLEPLTYEQLEAREGSLGSTYCPDLLDLLIGLFTYLGTVPPLLFGAESDALTQTLIHGCHRPPAVPSFSIHNGAPRVSILESFYTPSGSLPSALWGFPLMTFWLLKRH